MILGFMGFNFIAGNTNGSFKKLIKVFENLDVGGGNNKRSRIFKSSAFPFIFSNTETSVSVGISGKISENVLIAHKKSISGFKLKSNRKDLPTEISLSDVDDVTALLQNNDGEFVTNMINASDKIGTSPLGDCYSAMCTTRLIPALNPIQGFRRKFEYGTGSINTLSSEWGGVNNTRFFVSSQGSVTPDASLMGNDVANIFITAQEGYKVVFQAGGRAKYLYTPPGGQNDPAHLRQMAACQFYQGQCIEKTYNIALVHFKPTLIDLESYTYAKAA